MEQKREKNMRKERRGRIQVKCDRTEKREKGGRREGQGERCRGGAWGAARRREGEGGGEREGSGERVGGGERGGGRGADPPE